MWLAMLAVVVGIAGGAAVYICYKFGCWWANGNTTTVEV